MGWNPKKVQFLCKMNCLPQINIICNFFVRSSPERTCGLKKKFQKSLILAFDSKQCIVPKLHFFPRFSSLCNTWIVELDRNVSTTNWNWKYWKISPQRKFMKNDLITHVPLWPEQSLNPSFENGRTQYICFVSKRQMK